MTTTAMTRKSVSAPMKYLAQRRGAPYGPMEVLHFGEGKAYEDTKYLARNGANVTPYDPNSEHELTRDPGILDQHYDLGIAIYVFNTLKPGERYFAFKQLIDCCDTAIIAVRTDKVKGTPIFFDGVETKRGTFQTQLNANQWLRYFQRNTFRWIYQLHNGGHYAMFEVE